MNKSEIELLIAEFLKEEAKIKPGATDEIIATSRLRFQSATSTIIWNKVYSNPYKFSSPENYRFLYVLELLT